MLNSSFLGYFSLNLFTIFWFRIDFTLSGSATILNKFDNLSVPMEVLSQVSTLLIPENDLSASLDVTGRVRAISINNLKFGNTVRVGSLIFP